MSDTPSWSVVPPVEAERRRPIRRARRNWKPVIDALVAGRTLFVAEATDSDVKYIALALSRRNKGEYLRSQVTVRDEQRGRMLWVVSKPAEVEVVEA